ncbi:low temperature requirement protein LtrA [Phyllobacterium ifriqiyense]|uniref:Low temperature requirement protein LtrA n=1 Tax=Phyllobacterium ifriqiyense TaxID=314238 RepID=A0ABU0S725_9HYPH|nr:low temperature requirement protein A [Phyllobacterium ifriqiyense]MDQ0996556.1 low temperature requirement protein LtrA [Phyllobacterium ifriqiyense]
MVFSGAIRDYSRKKNAKDSSKVDFVELFFDLVFVFAITQISHLLLHDLTLKGLVESALLLAAVWWVWVYTTWVTNWMDPSKPPIRAMLFVLMLAGLVLSTSIPTAFGERGLIFAIAFVFMQLGRSLFMLWAVRRHNQSNFRNFLRISIWLAISGMFWIAGGLADPEHRIFFWGLALAVELGGPALGFRTPGLGSSTTADWDIDGDHMAERAALFIIIALGESILVSGATFAEQHWNLISFSAFLTTFTASVAMWLVYFNVGQSAAHHKITATDDPGRVARIAYTYIHVLLVAGIIVVAVSDELILAHPSGHIETATIWTSIGGTALYLLGNLLFKFYIAGRPPLSHMVGLGLCAVLACFASHMSPLMLGLLTSLILIIVTIWELKGRPNDQHHV